MASPDSIKGFYAGQTVLVTGGSGFVGKVIIEKILRSCPDVRMVYTLLRSKKGVSVADRLQKIKQAAVFDVLRTTSPKSLDKFDCLTGDISESNLGLSDLEAELIRKTVTIVIHSAATVRFNEPVKVALNINCVGTRRLLDLCRDIKKLKGFVHISTAYCNPGQELIEEKVYTSPLKFDLDWHIACAETFSDDKAWKIMTEMHGFFPNTYTLTKNFAEQLVQDYRTRFDLPIIIVRPSIITTTYAEPFPGWVDTLNGAIGIGIEIGRGSIASFNLPPHNVMEFVPLDFTAHLAIVAAWFEAIKPSKEIRVFNLTSGGRHSITWQEANSMFHTCCRKLPTKYTMLYPYSRLIENRYEHAFFDFFHTLLPAVLADVLMRLMGEKPMMLMIQRKVRVAFEAERYFVTRAWNFTHTRLCEVLEASRQAVDGDEFQFDVCKVDYVAYCRTGVLGVQKHILKTTEAERPAAMRQLKILHVLWLMYYAFIYAALVYVIYKVIV